MDVKIILWSIALFFGSGIIFRAVGDATQDSPVGVRLALQLLALAVIVTAVVLVVRRRR